jgi:CTP synthase (UTP-ammonia lyase)
MLHHLCLNVAAEKSNQEEDEMNAALRVGIIGDFDPQLRYHVATNEALRHAASALSVMVDYAWLPTPSLDNTGCAATLQQFDALWCAPASPYKSMQGALQAIQFAREQGWPFIGT